MKKILYSCFMSLACFSTCNPLPQELSSSAIPAMTPAQFDDSLRLSKEELELENALQLTTPQQSTDLNIEMDSVKSPVTTQVKTPLSAAFELSTDVSPEIPSAEEPSDANELIIDNKESLPVSAPTTPVEPTSIEQKRRKGIL